MDPAARSGLEAGCSALSWHTADGKHLWGRNYDFDRLAEGSGVLFLPRNLEYSPRVGAEGPVCRSRYACMGMGLSLSPTPVLYEGLNERGLMGGQLYYRGFACYGGTPRSGTLPIQPPFLVVHLLAQCATVEEVAAHLEQEAFLVDEPLLGTVPPLHWSFCDRTGESLVVEPDRDGLHLYRGTIGVMTNSPGYPWHRLNLLNYTGIDPRDRTGTDFGDGGPEPCFSGRGAQGMPGDWSSPSRFVRLAFLRRYAIPGGDEEEGVARMFRLLQSAAFPLGMVQVGETGPRTELDTQVSAYDYTVYTGVCCAESLRYYWTTYDNQRIRYAQLESLLMRKEALLLPLNHWPEFLRAEADEFRAAR